MQLQLQAIWWPMSPQIVMCENQAACCSKSQWVVPNLTLSHHCLYPKKSSQWPQEIAPSYCPTPYLCI